MFAECTLNAKPGLSNSSGLKRVFRKFESLRFCDRLVLIDGRLTGPYLTIVTIMKLYFQISTACGRSVLGRFSEDERRNQNYASEV